MFLAFRLDRRADIVFAAYKEDEEQAQLFSCLCYCGREAARLSEVAPDKRQEPHLLRSHFTCVAIGSGTSIVAESRNRSIAMLIR